MSDTAANPTIAPTPLAWRFAIAAGIILAGLAAYASRDLIGLRGQSAVGVIFFFGLVAAFSTNLRAVNWRTVGWGIVLQVVLALLVLKVGYTRDVTSDEARQLEGQRAAALIGAGISGPMAVLPATAFIPPTTKFIRPFYAIFEVLGGIVKQFIGFSDKGAEFVFGNLARPGDLALKPGSEFLFIFAFKALPPILFVSAFFTVLYHFGILQWCVRLMARGMVYLMGTSGAETLSVAANVFMGQTEAPLIVKPYVPRMTNSELFTLMVSGFAHISGGMMVVYINYGADPVAVITTCVMACPCSLYLAKLFLPELATPETAGTVQTQHEKSPFTNAIDAAATGTSDGLRLALNVAAMLIVFIAFVALFDALLAGIKPGLLWAGVNADRLRDWPDDLSLGKVFGWLFAPAAFLMGVDEKDARTVGSLLGSKLAINEHFAYLQMKTMMAIPHYMTERSYKLAAFALTGFANFASVGIQLGGIGALAPDRRHDLARLGGRALFVGFIATLLNAAIAGILMDVFNAMNIDHLIAAARAVRLRAHAPYSGFQVGAALETPAGVIIAGCNVENATYGLTICAERVAVVKAISDGETKFTRIAIVADTDAPTPPCGACRQILWEFGGDLEIILANLHEVKATYRLADLLPLPFDGRLLGKRELTYLSPTEREN